MPAAKRKPKAEEDYGLTLEDLFATPLSFDMVVAGKKLTVEWSPASYTPALEDRVMALATDDESEEEQELESELEALVDPAEIKDRDQRAELIRKRTEIDAKLGKLRHDRLRSNQDAVRDVLCSVLVSWSLTTKGVMVPIDDEHLKAMPPSFLSMVFDALWDNVGPKDETESLPDGQS